MEFIEVLYHKVSNVVNKQMQFPTESTVKRVIFVRLNFRGFRCFF